MPELLRPSAADLDVLVVAEVGGLELVEDQDAGVGHCYVLRYIVSRNSADVKRRDRRGS